MKSTPSKPVVAIGNFDGVHKGHAALLAAGRRIAAFENRELVALTFEPHPREYFKPGDAPFRITPESVKERRLKALGVDRVDVLDFNQIMAGLTAEQFIEMIIVGHMNASHVIVGADFHFGKNRGGNVETLRADKRFQVDGVALELLAGQPVSSTRIREALKAGDIPAANAMLGWAWEIEGIVQHGDKRGRELGYPTANIPLENTIVPAYGVYAAQAYVNNAWQPAAINIGIRPMFETKTPLLEAYILNFTGDLYSQTLRVQPVQKIRDEMKFDGLESLKAQMSQDIAQVSAILDAH